jgi:nitrogen regulatory protein PII
MSAVTVVLSRQRAKRVIAALLDENVHHVMLNNARGTLIRDRWYQSLLPTISPELSVLQMLVPDPLVDSIMETAARHAQLHRSGAGAMYSQPCADLYHKGALPLWPIDRAERPEQDASATLRENLTAIYLISQGERTDAVCRAAMQAGGHGPVVQYSEGHGLRDQLGWLRITSKPIKEVVSVVVDNVDADLVFAAMARAGQVERAARGLIYRMPVQKGLVNIDSIYAGTRHAATMQQIIRAIDDIKGGKDWRDQNAIGAQGGAAAGLSFVAELTPPAASEDRALLSVLVPRERARSTALALIEAGAPGANIDFLHSHTNVDGGSHAEIAQIRVVLDRLPAADLEAAALGFADDVIAFTQPVTQLMTYLRPRQKRAVRRYRGVAMPS